LATNYGTQVRQAFGGDGAILEGAIKRSFGTSHRIALAPDGAGRG